MTKHSSNKNFTINKTSDSIKSNPTLDLYPTRLIFIDPRVDDYESLVMVLSTLALVVLAKLLLILVLIPPIPPTALPWKVMAKSLWQE
ncbi:MAG: hypothetical protein V7K50_03630 [Nostoc sp.]